MKNIKEVTLYNNGTLYVADGFDWIWLSDPLDGETVVYSSKNPGNLSEDEISKIKCEVERFAGYTPEEGEAERLADLMGEPLEYERVKVEYGYYNGSSWERDYHVFGDGYTLKDWLQDGEIPFEEDETEDGLYHVLDAYGERTGEMYSVYSEEPTNDQLADS